MLTLFYAPRTCALGPHIALEEAGAVYESRRIDFSVGEQRSAAYLAINPKGRVPALVTDRGVLTECAAILVWIAQTFPEAHLADLGDAFAFAELQAFDVWLATHVHVFFAHVFRPGRYADGEASAAAMRAKSVEALDAAFDAIEDRLARLGPFVHGEAYTISDAYLFVFEGWLFDRGFAGPERFPLVHAHFERIAARPATQRALLAEAVT